MANRKNESLKNLWEKHNIPAFEYCKLDRAAELLGCKVGDLLHWAETGAVELCLKFNGFEAAMRPPSNVDYSPEKWIKENTDLSSLIGISASYPGEVALSGFRAKMAFDLNSHSESEDDVFRYHFEYENDPALKTPIVNIFGLWAISPRKYGSLFSTLGEGNNYPCTAINIIFKVADEPRHKDVIYVTPLTEQAYDKNMILIQPVKTLFEITIDDLFITRCQMEKINDNKGKPLPNYINGGVPVIDINDMDGDIKKTHKNQEINSSKRERILLAAMYVMKNHPNECLRKNGKESLAATAKAICNHSYSLFGTEEPPIANVRIISEIIGDGYKLPKERKRAGRLD